MSVEIQTAVGIIKAIPEVIDVSKKIWKSLRKPEQLPEGNEGISENSFYSEKYKFSIAIPDDNWRFWKPSNQFLSGLGSGFGMPTRDMPIIILSKQMVKLFRPNVNVLVEDVGSFATIKELTELFVLTNQQQGLEVDNNNIHISDSNNSSVIIMNKPYYTSILYQVGQLYLYGSYFYTVTSSYVPISDSPSLFGGLQDIVNSFKIIKG